MLKLYLKSSWATEGEEVRAHSGVQRVSPNSCPRLPLAHQAHTPLVELCAAERWPEQRTTSRCANKMI